MNNIDFTLVIPTRNRHNYLKRCLEFYRLVTFKIIICDSSINSFPFTFDESRFSYYHLPGLSYPNKLSTIACHIKSKYAGFCADDDFILESAIIKCIEFLDKNEDYSSVQGEYVAFQSFVGRIHLFRKVYTNSFNKNINEKLASERLISYAQDYFQIYYAIHRVDTFKSILAKGSPSIINLNLYEFLIAFVSIINGKHRVLPILYGLREILPKSAGSSENIVVSRSDKGEKMFRCFVETVSTHLSKNENLTLEQSRLIVYNAIAKYKFWLQSSQRYNFIKTVLPQKLQDYLKMLLFFKNGTLRTDILSHELTVKFELIRIEKIIREAINK